MTTPAPRTDKPGGRRFRDLLERERHDVAMLAGHVAEMYDHITSGRVSKPNTKPFEVIALYEERLEEECREAAAEAVAPWRAALERIVDSIEGAAFVSPNRARDVEAALGPARALLTDTPAAESQREALDVERPRIVCLCGSTRFYDEFQQANYDETMAGRIVLSVGFYPHAKAKHGHGEGVGHDSSEKITLDELHKRKIDLADEVLVLNVGGYIGASTRSEIEYAVDHGKPVRWLEQARALFTDIQEEEKP